jgi:tetratricopeptide (TPR) repeat protein
LILTAQYDIYGYLSCHHLAAIRETELMAEQTHKKSHVLLIYLGLIVSVLAAYEQVRGYKFVDFDDRQYVFENPHVKGGFTVGDVKWAFTTTRASNWHPLTWFSHMLDWQLFGPNAGGHHIVSLLFHIANALLLFLVLKRMTGALWQSAFVAALFALHPLHVESVAWVSERKDVLSAFFWLLTMWAYVWYTEQPGTKRYLLIVLFFALGLMAKPMLVTLPFVLLLLDYWPLGRLRWGGKKMSPAGPAGLNRHPSSALHLVVEKLPLFALSAASSVVTCIAQQTGAAIKSIEAFPLKLRIFNAAASYLGYVGKIFYPVHLAVFYPYSKAISFGPAVLLVGTLVVLAFWARRRPWLAVGSLWYLGTLVPVIGLVQVGDQAMADRYTYLPSVGVFIAVAWGAAEITAKWKHQKIVLATFAALVLTVLFVCTRVQVGYWKNDSSLFKHALDVTENNAIMHERYATALLEQGKLDEAFSHYEQALRLRPEIYRAYAGMGLVFLKRQQNDKAIECFRQALRLYPDYTVDLNNLGVLLAEQGKTDEALADFQKAVRCDPDYARSYYNIALLKVGQKEHGQAIKYLQTALQKKPDWPEASSKLAECYLVTGDMNQAVNYWRKTLESDPNDIKTLNNLAWFLATTEDANLQNPTEAVKYAKRIFELTGSYQQPVFLDTLAAAYAAAGNFPEAVKTAGQALKLLEAAGRKDLAEKVRRELELYKSGRPYREK